MMDARWSKLCWAKSASDSDCNENAWLSPLKFLDATPLLDLNQADIDK